MHLSMENPEQSFQYNSLNTYVLSAIVTKRTGETLTEYLTPRLFGPLGITKYYWETCPKGITKGGWGLFLCAEDMAKLGQLYLQRGKWNGQQLVSEYWIEISTARHLKTQNDTYGYGYQLWMEQRPGSFEYNGMLGQNVIIYPDMDMVPRTFIFGAKAAAGYKRAKLTIKLINAVADVVNNDKSIGGRIKVVFIEDYRVSNAEIIFAAADVSEQISTASKEASGTGNMKFMLNGALTLGTMDGANVEIVEEVGNENAFIFGMSSDEVIAHEKNRDYQPMDIFNNDPEIRRVLMQLVNGFYSPENPELFRDIYDSLLNTKSSDRADTYFILKDFRSYAEAHKKIDQAYRNSSWWAKAAILNVGHSGKFTSDRTIEEYVRDIWHLKKITVEV